MQSSRLTTDTQVLLSQVLDEIMERSMRGESPKLDEYAAKYPELADILKETMPVLMMINESSTGRGEAASAADLLKAANPPRQLGDFRLRRQIGRGGMGVVFEADQLSMGRRVALKILPLATLADSKNLQRFKNEVRAAAALDHPNIVSIYSVGDDSGVHYYAMQLIRGQNLWSVMRSLKNANADDSYHENSIQQVVSQSIALESSSNHGEVSDLRSSDADCDDSSFAAAAMETVANTQDATSRRARQLSYYQSIASLGIQAARALQHAHQVGIVHRDIKPANLLLDEHAQLYITDFGLASIEAGPNATATGDIIGTIRYMPPEQALGKHELIDHRVDVYALGVTLYELLTLEPAFQGRDRQELLQKVSSQEPPRPRKVESKVPVELDTIVMKAIAKDRDERYATAVEFADDLLRFVQNQPIHARPVSVATRMRKWTQRNSLLVTISLTLLLFASLATSIVLVRANRRERDLRAQAEVLRRHSEGTTQLAVNAVDRMYLDVAVNWISEDRGLSDKQRELLTNAQQYYSELVERMNLQDPHSQQVAAVARHRMAVIHEHNEEYGHACEQLRRAIAIWKSLRADAAHRDDFRIPLQEAMLNLASLYNLLGQYDRAEGLFAELEMLTEQSDESKNISAEATAEFRRDVANYRILKLNTAIGRRDWSTAEELLAEARAAVEAHTALDPLSRIAYDLRARCGLAWTVFLRNTGLMAEAEELARGALYNVNYGRLNSSDDRRSLTNELAITRELGTICEQTGQLDEAAALLERTLELRRSRFVDQMSPAEVMSHSFFTRGFKMNEYVRPIAFGEYVNDQLFLSSILSRLDRPHQAELLIAESVRTMWIMAELYPSSPRYRTALANAYAELAMLLSDRRPEESRVALRQASRVWEQAAGNVPAIANYRSGLRDAASDYEWFRHQLPDLIPIDGFATELKTGRPLQIESHYTGIYLLDAGLTKNAITYFEKSLKEEPETPVYDWLYLALAHQEQGDAEPSRDNYQRAVAWFDHHSHQDPELAELFERVTTSIESNDASLAPALNVD